METLVRLLLLFTAPLWESVAEASGKRHYQRFLRSTAHFRSATITAQCALHCTVCVCTTATSSQSELSPPW